MLVYFSKLVITLNRGSNQIFYEARMPSYTGCTEVLPTCSVNRAQNEHAQALLEAHGESIKMEVENKFYAEKHMTQGYQPTPDDENEIRELFKEEWKEFGSSMFPQQDPGTKEEAKLRNTTKKLLAKAAQNIVASQISGEV